METVLDRRGVTACQIPTAFSPLDGLARGHLLRQIHTLQPGECPGLCHSLIGITLRPRHDAAPLRPFVPENAGEFAGINAGDAHYVMGFQIVRQALARAPVADTNRHIAHHQPADMNATRLNILVIDADIANMGIGQRYDLTRIRGIGEDLLITGHRGIKNDFPNGAALCANRDAAENRAIFKSQQCLGIQFGSP